MIALRQLFEESVRKRAATGAGRFADAILAAKRARQLAPQCEADALGAAIAQLLSALERDLLDVDGCIAEERAHARFEGLLAQHAVVRRPVLTGVFAPRRPVFRWPRWLMQDGER
ncbi:MAG: hypothetical protein V4857_27315 [Pseudomonadota bacterium]